MRANNSNNKIHGYDKKLTAEWQRSNLIERITLSLGFRNFATWFFLIISMIYILYSSNLLLTNQPEFCSPTVHQQHLLSNSTVSTISTSTESDPAEYYNLPIVTPITRRYDTELKHIVFGIAASSSLWEQRKPYIRQWWRPKVTRGVVWLDNPVKMRRNEGLPEIQISGNTSRFRYENRHGRRSALRISRIVSETVRLGMRDVRWFVMGDDDTVFVVENLVRVLEKYDHRGFYYVGSSSESHVQNMKFTYGMAYGGGGFAISYPLARALERVQDRCMARYPELYGSDDRIHACLAEIGVPLSREPGFHQYDVHGNLMGLLAAHPVAPLVSLHHLDVVDPIFPGTTRQKSLQRLFQPIKLDPESIMQQSICYDDKRSWSISVSWGYVVQIFRGIVSPRELETPSRTFLNWHKRADYTAYTFNSRPVSKNRCQKPIVFFMSTVRFDRSKKQTVSVYTRQRIRYPSCRWNMASPAKIDSVVVFKKPETLRWRKSPRRDCCRVMASNKSSNLYISVGKCRDGEVVEV